MSLAGQFSLFPQMGFYVLPFAIHRDVTDHLQLLLRKAGHNLHTTAEREVVRTIKEKCCYIALNPAKEEKDLGGKWEEFKLPDGNAVQVCLIRVLLAFVRLNGLAFLSSLARSDSAHRKFYSIQNW
jgi:hypothetical protein